MQERRRDTRVPQNTVGNIRYGAAGHERPCSVIDLSPRGAGIKLASAFGVPDVFHLVINGEAHARRCRVVWREGVKLGVLFE